MKYLVLMLEENDGASWTARVPDFPGCLSSAGSSAEVMVSIREAAAAWVESSWEAGRGIPAPLASRQDPAINDAVKEGWQIAVLEVDSPAGVIDAMQRVILSEPDFIVFMNALANPAPCNERLAAAIRRQTDSGAGLGWAPKQ